jgi:hypothetical protein
MYDNLLANVPTDLWIGGKWRKSSDGARFDVIDPATENMIASVASASVDDAKAAIDAASDAFEGWAARKPRERAEILRKAFELIVRDAERFAKLITIENGKALSDSKGEVLYSAEFFRWNAEEAVRNIGQLYNAPSSGARVVVQHKPAGVAVLVTPWNFPAAMATRKIGPALVLRGSGAHRRRAAHGPVRREPHPDVPQAGRGRAATDTVELPGRDGNAQDRPGARGRVHRRPQARRADSAFDTRASQGLRGRGTAAGSGQHRHWGRARSRRAAGGSPGGPQDRLHRQRRGG